MEPISPETDTQMPPNMVKPSTEIITPPEPPTATAPTQKSELTPESSEPKMGDTRVANGQNQVYFLGFGWIEDNDEPNVGMVVDGDGDINKMVGIMGGQSAEGCSESEQP